MESSPPTDAPLDTLSVSENDTKISTKPPVCPYQRRTSKTERVKMEKTAETLRRQLAEAVKEEDFLAAHQIKVRLGEADGDDDDDDALPDRASRTFSTARRASLANRHKEPLYYHSYLQLDKITESCHLESEKAHPGKPAHDEHLFIIIHQVYELWFKQILWELNSVIKIFKQEDVPEKDMFVVSGRLKRITEIWRIILDQLNVLETMSPTGFLEFRDFLFPASGFQSVQFRMIENQLGLDPAGRIKYGKRGYCTYLNEQHAAEVNAAEGVDTLHDLMVTWLERTPFLKMGSFDFWGHYRQGVDNMLKKDRAFIETTSGRYPDIAEKQLESVEATKKSMDTLFDEDLYNKEKASGSRFSYKALQAALLINLYQDEPIFHQPYQILNGLKDIDELMTMWRYRHSLMVHRMLGVKMGTGGSSGFAYLRATASQHRVFKDLFNLSSFLIPKDQLPELPEDYVRSINFPKHGQKTADGSEAHDDEILEMERKLAAMKTKAAQK